MEAPLTTVDLATLTAQLRALRDEALPRIAGAADLAALDELDLHYLGRKGGALSGLMRGIGALPVEDRPRVGAAVNEVREAVESALGEARGRAGSAALEATAGRGDGRRHRAGPGHPARDPPSDRRDRRRGSPRSSGSSGS